MFEELRGALVFVEHGEAELLDLLEVVVHLKLHSEHGIQVVHSGFGASQLNDRRHKEEMNHFNVMTGAGGSVGAPSH